MHKWCIPFAAFGGGDGNAIVPDLEQFTYNSDIADWSSREGGASFEYSFNGNSANGETILTLYRRHGDILWEEGFHKYCVGQFLHEIDAIFASERFRRFPQEKLDFLIGELRGRGNSNATVNRKLSALRKLLGKALKMGEITSLPEFRRLKERAGRIRFLSYEEEDRLFAALRARSALYADLAAFLVDTGARLGEAIGLRWNDVEAGRATFWLTKSGRSRSVPLTRRAQQAILDRAGCAKGPFAGVRQPQFRKVWHEAKAEAGLGADADVVPHVLRHTCASRLVQGGVDLRRVQIWLGHQTLQMTMRYAHLATRDLDICLPVLERR